MDCSLWGSSVHGIHQARISEWVALSFSRGSSQPRNQIWLSCSAGRFFTELLFCSKMVPSTLSLFRTLFSESSCKCEMSISYPPCPVNVILLWRGIFSGVTNLKISRWGHLHYLGEPYIQWRGPYKGEGEEIRHSWENTLQTQMGRPGEDGEDESWCSCKPRNTKDLAQKPWETNKVTMASTCQVFCSPPFSPCLDLKHS